MGMIREGLGLASKVQSPAAVSCSSPLVMHPFIAFPFLLVTVLYHMYIWLHVGYVMLYHMIMCTYSIIVCIYIYVSPSDQIRSCMSCDTLIVLPRNITLFQCKHVQKLDAGDKHRWSRFRFMCVLLSAIYKWILVKRIAGWNWMFWFKDDPAFVPSATGFGHVPPQYLIQSTPGGSHPQQSPSLQKRVFRTV